MLLRKRSQSEKATYCYNFNYMMICKRQNYEDSKRSVVTGEEGGVTRWNTEDLEAVKLFCVILWVPDIMNLTKPIGYSTQNP